MYTYIYILTHVNVYIHVLGQMTKADGRPNKKPHVIKKRRQDHREAAATQTHVQTHEMCFYIYTYMQKHDYNRHISLS